VETALAAIEPRLCFRGDLFDCVALCLVAGLRRRGAGLFAMASRGFRGHVATARELGMLKAKVFAISAGCTHTVACLDTGVYTFGDGTYGPLGHGPHAWRDGVSACAEDGGGISRKQGGWGINSLQSPSGVDGGG
jgi:hypothetical protein